MKNFLIIIAVAVSMIYAETAYTGESRNKELSDNWWSYITTITTHEGSGLPIACMENIIPDESTILTIGYFPGSCESGIIFLTLPSEKARTYGTEAPIPGKLRIDRNKIINISYYGNIGEKFFHLIVEEATGEDLLRGRTVRFQVGDPEGDPLYGTFSLSGFTAAHERAQRLCYRARDNME